MTSSNDNSSFKPETTLFEKSFDLLGDQATTFTQDDSEPLPQYSSLAQSQECTITPRLALNPIRNERKTIFGLRSTVTTETYSCRTHKVGVEGNKEGPIVQPEGGGETQGFLRMPCSNCPVPPPFAEDVGLPYGPPSFSFKDACIGPLSSSEKQGFGDGQGTLELGGPPTQACTSGRFRADIEATWGADIRLSSADSNNKLRPTMNVTTGMGRITAEFHTSGCRTPFQLNATTKSGSVTLHLPRSFRGFVSLTTERGTTTFSETLALNTADISKFDSTKRYFVGSLPESSDLDDVGFYENWDGDQITVVSKSGGIKLDYVDEFVRGQRCEFKFLGCVFVIE